LVRNLAASMRDICPQLIPCEASISFRVNPRSSLRRLTSAASFSTSSRDLNFCAILHIIIEICKLREIRVPVGHAKVRDFNRRGLDFARESKRTEYSRNLGESSASPRHARYQETQCNSLGSTRRLLWQSFAVQDRDIRLKTPAIESLLICLVTSWMVAFGAFIP